MKLLIRWGSTWYEGSGVLIDPLHVLTSGSCVHQGSGGSWADEIIVVPGYEDGSAPYGTAKEVNLYSWTGWINYGDFNYDMGLIELDRPIGALTGWHGYGYNTACSFYTDPSRTWYNVSYPAESPYSGEYMYWWWGYFDDCETYGAWFNNRSYDGQSGSGVYHIDSGDRYVYLVLSAGTTSPPWRTWDVRITPTRFGHIRDDIIGGDTPGTFDLIPLNVQVNPGTVTSGGQLSSMTYVVHNYSSASWSGTVTAKIYLSTNDNISTYDTLIQTHQFWYSFGPKDTVVTNVTPPPTIPPGLSGGDYYIGVILDVSDYNTTNNDSDGQDAARVSIIPTCTYSISPTSQHFSATGGTGSVNVTTQGGCSWTATSNNSWIHITSGSSGTGNGTVNYSVAANSGTSSRTGTMTVAGHTFTVTQDGAGGCDSHFQRTIAPQCVVQATGGTFTVTVQITADRDFTGLALDEDLVGFPEDWSPWQVTPIQNDGATYNAATKQWLWLSVGNGETKTVIYQVSVPSGQPLGAYTINGVVRSSSPTFAGSVCGDDQVTIEVSCGTYSIDYVVAHWVNGDVDPNDPCQISLDQILQAIAWWANGTPVPQTGGQTIDLDKILDLIAKWANGTCIESTAAQALLLPKALSADEAATLVEATRSITASAEGQVEVTVAITAKQAITGLALDEDLPQGWTITPIDNAGATFNPQETQWLWLAVDAGETKTIRYRVEIPNDASPDVLYEVNGVIRAASPALMLEVLGNTQLGKRVPVGKIEAVAIPNPVRDVHTVTFQVKGELVSLVETIKVQIFDLAGRLVYEKEEAGTSLDWHTDDRSGEYLANGIYLYKAYVKAGDEWIPTTVGKVAVLR